MISPPKYTSSPKKGRNAAQTLKTLVLNAQSLSNKIEKIHCLIDEEKPDIIAITETWLNHTIPSSDIIPSSYTVYRKDRSEGRGGGVLIAVQNKLLSSPCEKLDSNCEIIWTKIELSNAKDLYVGVYYKPPTSKKCVEELQMSIEKLKNSNSIICLCEDINVPDICWEENSVKTGSNQVALSESLLDIVTEASLSQMNSSPTWGDHLLDLYLTNNPTLV